MSDIVGCGPVERALSERVQIVRQRAIAPGLHPSSLFGGGRGDLLSLSMVS